MLGGADGGGGQDLACVVEVPGESEGGHRV